MNRLLSLLALSISVVVLVSGCGSGGSGAGGNDNPPAGANKLPKYNISKNASDSTSPSIAANSGGTVYIAWEESSQGTGKDVYLASSTNSGGDFFQPIGISKSAYCSNKSSSQVSEDISLKAGENGNLYLAWIDKLLDSAKVRFFNNGDCKILSDASLKSASRTNINLGVNGDISVAWAGAGSSARDIYYRRSGDGGVKFSNPINISGTPDSDSSAPLLAIEGSYNIKAVWVEGGVGSRGIAFSKSYDATGEFLPHNILSDSGNDSHCPAIASSLNGTYMAYKGNNAIYYSTWNPITLGFIDPQEISPGSVSPSCPGISSASDGTTHIVWEDNNSIWLASSYDGGIFFTYPVKLSSPSHVSSSPEIIASGTYVVVVWEANIGGNKEIFTRLSADKGKSFYPERNLSDSPSVPSTSPAVATDSQKYFYFVWEEGAEGSRDIYFLRSTPDELAGN